MMKQVIWFLFSCSAISCNGQENIKITLTNRSSLPIDSVIIPYKEEQFEGVINQNETRSLIVHLKDKEYQREGAFDIYIYQRGKWYRGSWGFHFMGEFAKKETSLYLFDHGLNYKDTALLPPKVFTLYIWDKITQPLDSITAAPESFITAIKKPRSFELVLDFESLVKTRF